MKFPGINTIIGFHTFSRKNVFERNWEHALLLQRRLRKYCHKFASQLSDSVGYCSKICRSDENKLDLHLKMYEPSIMPKPA